MKQTATILIVALCIVCATMISGCLNEALITKCLDECVERTYTETDPFHIPTHSDSYYKLVKPTPRPTPNPTPKRYIPAHADGDKRKCGTCHTYPTFDNNNDPNKPTPRPTMIPTTLPTQRYTTPPYTTPYITSPIPNDYYSQPCKLSTDQSMQEYLANSNWIDDYDAGGWDCSQMASYMEFMLENCGYNVVIRIADVNGEAHGHAWILVEFQQGWLAYECTDRYWVYPNEATARSYDPYGTVSWNPSMYDAGVQYESIHDVWNRGYKHYSNGEEVFLAEFGWWIE